jgi:two-component system OmpR family response regulator
MHILVVEDDSVLADAITHTLRDHGYAVDFLTTGTDADRALATDEYDLVILDIELPYIDGYEVLHRLRARKSKVPVLILTARDSVHDRIHGLDTGADDYLTKPFQMGELLARIRALIRRAQGVADNQIRVGRLTVDLASRLVHVGDAQVDFSPRELAVLELLAARAGRVVSKDALIQSLYNWNEDVGPNAIEIHVHRIRKKLQDVNVSIRTVRGLGYLMEAVEDGAETAGDAG